MDCSGKFCGEVEVGVFATTILVFVFFFFFFFKKIFFDNFCIQDTYLLR